jgi:hypothetical protein
MTRLPPIRADGTKSQDPAHLPGAYGDRSARRAANSEAYKIDAQMALIQLATLLEDCSAFGSTSSKSKGSVTALTLPNTGYDCLTVPA